MYASKQDGQSTNNDRIYGIDISHHQANIDWSKISPTAQFPVSFIVIRATYGTETLDRKFLEHWKNALAIQGLTMGAYHYYLNYQDPRKQAKVFCGQLLAVGFDISKNFYAIDVEDRKTKKPQREMAADLQKFITCVNGKLDPSNTIGIAPVIYTTTSYWNEYLGAQSGLSYNLWVARYYADEPLDNPMNLPAQSPVGAPGQKTVGLPDCKTDYHIWQYSREGRIEGIAGDLDLDVSTIAKIRSLFPKGEEQVKAE